MDIADVLPLLHSDALLREQAEKAWEALCQGELADLSTPVGNHSSWFLGCRSAIDGTFSMDSAGEGRDTALTASGSRVPPPVLRECIPFFDGPVSEPPASPRSVATNTEGAADT
eukprot:351759-Alexandrium_andersonii.AAC.1